MPHTCSHLLVRCMDFRLEGPIHEYLKQHRLVGKTDIISLPGGIKDLVANGRESVTIQQICMAVELHGVSNIMLMNHSDCGAYSQHHFGDSSDEAAFHYRQLCQAVETLRVVFDDNIIYTLLYGYKNQPKDPSFKIQQLYIVR